MRMNNYISFLCTLLNIKIPKVFFKESDKFHDLKNKPINKELFQVKDTSICTSYPIENVICVNLDACKDRSLVQNKTFHELFRFKSNQKAANSKRNENTLKKGLLQVLFNFFNFSFCTIEAIFFTFAFFFLIPFF